MTILHVPFYIPAQFNSKVTMSLATPRSQLVGETLCSVLENRLDICVYSLLMLSKAGFHRYAFLLETPMCRQHTWSRHGVRQSALTSYINCKHSLLLAREQIIVVSFWKNVYFDRLVGIFAFPLIFHWRLSIYYVIHTPRITTINTSNK